MKIVDITFEDLEPVMPDILSGSQFLSVTYREEDFPDSLIGQCMSLEDACIYVLKSGKPIVVTDWYCEGENNSLIKSGKPVTGYDMRPVQFGLPPEESKNMEYEVYLEDFVRAANYPSNSEIIKNLIITESFDMEDTDCFLQSVVLGDIVYS